MSFSQERIHGQSDNSPYAFTDGMIFYDVRVRELRQSRRARLEAARQQAEREKLIAPVNDRSTEMRWLKGHRSQYANQWVALDGDRLLSSGDNAREVYLKARELGVNKPFVARVEPEDALPFGGW